VVRRCGLSKDMCVLCRESRKNGGVDRHGVVAC
jgi:hypothetical protein